ncbi:MAG: hypothetical protein IT163_14435 [Bryobacterales bacterium]|nr:hypothetical protein [Bryobacterales bacterium]
MMRAGEAGQSFQALLAEAGEQAVPGSARAMDEVTARLEELRSLWPGEAAGMGLEELLELRRGLNRVEALVEHAARRRMGLARHLLAVDSGYTVAGQPAGPAGPTWAGPTWVCVG